MIDNFKNREFLEWFNPEFSHSASLDLCNTLNSSNIESFVENFWTKFEKFYLINCSPFEIDKRKNFEWIYEILKRFKHTAEWRSLEVLIGKYNKEILNEMMVKTEELKKQYESMGVEIEQPCEYMHIVWFYWWTSWRTIQEVIKTLIKQFPDKIERVNSINQ